MIEFSSSIFFITAWWAWPKRLCKLLREIAGRATHIIPGTLEDIDDGFDAAGGTARKK
jgi:hypothetical protein